MAYGPGARHTIDVFAADRGGPMVVFIHGGYWQALDGSFFSHMARGLNAHGITHLYEEFDDGHMGTAYRFDRSLPLLVEALRKS